MPIMLTDNAVPTEGLDDDELLADLSATQHATTTQFPVFNPATGDIIAHVDDNGTEEAQAALDSAASALPGWSHTTTRSRSEILYRAHRAMLDDETALAHLISLENGKPDSDARAEIRYAAEFFRWFAEEAVRGEGNFGPAPGGDAQIILSHRPVGIAALVTPWNFPAAMITRKLAPALAAGCTVVVKPAAETPLSAFAILRILRAAGLPAGVVSIVPTTRPETVVNTWLRDDRVRKLSFTGSTRIGKMLLHHCADRVVNASMELGGAAPFIVGPTAEIAAAVRGAMIAKFRNGGQACTAANCFFVHESVAEEFTAALTAAAQDIVVGPATDDGSTIGPMITRQAAAALEGLIESAVSSGARIHWRADVLELSDGNFVAPTILTNVEIDSSLVSEEIFGPVAPIVIWHDDRELLRRLNESHYGLASYLYSTDLSWAMRFSAELETGMVAINRGALSDPAAIFGGVKQSGLGREGGHEGMREFQELHYTSLAWDDSPAFGEK